MGQHTSREHLLLVAQGNCTFTDILSFFKETETDGGLKAAGGAGTENPMVLFSSGLFDQSCI